MSKEALKENPDDADALHALVITVYWRRDADLRGLTRMAKKCVSLRPSVSEFHVILGQLYLIVDKDYKNSVKCFDRALEIEWDPELLFNKGSALMLKQGREAIKAFEQYVEKSEKEEPNVPIACYTIASLYLEFGDEQKAYQFWKKGQAMERYTLKVPFREGYERGLNECKTSLQELMALIATKVRRGMIEPIAIVSTDSCDEKCGACGKVAKKLSVCGGCEKIQYCGAACQKKHWPVHKRACWKKYATVDGELKCGACSKTGKSLSVCGGCEKERYCGLECQKRHWPIHKKACRNTK
jgi:tetratricopeptide (TPR) repeat protein